MSLQVSSAAGPGLYGGKRLGFFWDKGVFTLFLIFWWSFFALLGLAIMFSPYSYEAPSGTPPARKHFLQLAAFVHQLLISVPHLGCAVQSASDNVENYL